MTKKHNFGVEFNVKFDTLGEYLKSVRTSKNITLEMVADKTKIRKYFIEALENNDHKHLPERTYSLGYLRYYAKFLELDNAEELVKYLDNYYNFLDPMYSKEDRDINQSRNILQSYKEDNGMLDLISLKKLDKKSNKKNNYLDLLLKNKYIVLLVIVFCLVVSSYLYIFLNLDNNQEEIAIEDAQIVIGNQEFAKIDKKNMEPEIKPVFKDTSNELSSVANTNTTNNNTNVAKVDPNKSVNAFEDKPNEDVMIIKKFPADIMPRVITLNFNQEVWVQIYQTDSPNIVYLDKIFKEGDSYKVPAVENISMKVGNFTALNFMIDNKKYTFSTNKKNSVVIANIKLTKDYLLQTYGSNVVAE
jgi:cytoskeletal protein RodZ